MPVRIRGLAFSLSLVVACSALPTLTWAEVCPSYTIGVDLSQVSHSAEAILGMAVGETITANDTLITKVTFWRIPSEAADPSPMKFWLTEVDSTGRPRTHRVIQEGPTLSIVADDWTQPTPIVFEFDPPIALPYRGTFCIWVQELCTGYFDLLSSLSDVYPGGNFWNTFRSNFEGCILRDFPRADPTGDLAFQIEFCDVMTPTRGPTWGQVKLRYR